MKNGRVILLSFIFVLLLAACGVQEEPTAESSDSGFQLDPIFSPLVQSLGEHVGVGIGTPFQVSSIIYQYTSNVLLVHDPQAALQDQYRLEALARYWNISEPEVPDPQDSSQIYVNGHIVWEEAQPLYVQLGANRMGKPLTEVHYNPTYGRYEQYFENMGVYRSETTAYGRLSILPYGTWTCGDQCSPPAPDFSGPLQFPKAPSEEVLVQAEAAFLEFARQAGMQFTGHPLSAAYLAVDGKVEKIYENVVLFWDQAQGGTVDLRYLPQEVGILPSALVAPAPGMHFFSVNGDLGHNLSQDFMVYISRHGTLARFGAPISEMHVGPNNSTRQCFEKLCLLYEATAPHSLIIRPEALGYQYYSRAPVPPEGGTTPDPIEPEDVSPVSQLRLTTWHDADFISQTDYQMIGAGVYDGRKPLVGAELVVTITLPDGTLRSYPMPPTSPNGQTQVMIDPIQAEKGTLVPYQVCIVNLPDSQFCNNGEYIIWDE